MFECIDELKDGTLGYRSHVAYAAGCVAKELHAGQVDKGGKDYFTSHLLPVAKYGHDWKEVTVGFLHDAAEDTDNTVEEVIDQVKQQLDELCSVANDKPTEEEWDEIANALHCLNHHNAPTREVYIEGISKNPLALKAKLNDLKSNMDISRIPNPTEKDLMRLERYKKEFAFLTARAR